MATSIDTSNNYVISNNIIANAVDCAFNCERGIKEIAHSLNCYNYSDDEFTSIIQTKNANNYGVDYIARYGDYLNGYRQYCGDKLNSWITISEYNLLSKRNIENNIKLLDVFNNWDNYNWCMAAYTETLNVLTLYSSINRHYGVVITVWNKSNNWSVSSDIYLISNIIPYVNNKQFNDAIKLSSKYPNIPSISNEDSYVQ